MAVAKELAIPGGDGIELLRRISAEIPVFSPEWAEISLRLGGLEPSTKEWARSIIARHGWRLGDEWLRGAMRAAGFVPWK